MRASSSLFAFCNQLFSAAHNRNRRRRRPSAFLQWKALSCAWFGCESVHGPGGLGGSVGESSLGLPFDFVGDGIMEIILLSSGQMVFLGTWSGSTTNQGLTLGLSCSLSAPFHLIQRWASFRLPSSCNMVRCHEAEVPIVLALFVPLHIYTQSGTKVFSLRS